MALKTCVIFVRFLFGITGFIYVRAKSQPLKLTMNNVNKGKPCTSCQLAITSLFLPIFLPKIVGLKLCVELAALKFMMPQPNTMQ